MAAYLALVLLGGISSSLVAARGWFGRPRHGVGRRRRQPPRKTGPGRPVAALPATGAKPAFRACPGHQWLQIEEIGPVTVVKFSHRRILTEQTVEIIAGQLFSLVRNEGRHHLVLNLGNIDRLATAMVGKLLILHRRLRAVGGSLVLCRIAPHLYEIFTLLGLTRILRIVPKEPEALQFIPCRRSGRSQRFLAQCS
jgi:anti-anti-sigma factor